MVASTLSRGQIAIVQVDTEDNDDPHINGTQNMNRDSVSFVLLAPVGQDTVIYFTDRSWNGSAFAGASGSAGAHTGENTYTWTATQNYAAGTVITITTAELAAAGISLSDTGETIYAYQGTNANTPTTFLFAIDVADNNLVFNGNLTNTGLVNGVDAVALAQDNVSYGERFWNINTHVLLQNIANNQNWHQNENSPQQDHIEGTNLHVAPDHQLWIAGISGGHGLISVSHDSTQNGGIGYNQQHYFQNTSNDLGGIVSTQRFWSPTHILFDTVAGKFFVVDSSGSFDRILQGNISDILNNPGVAPTMTILWQDDPIGSSDGDGITGMQIDKANTDIYFTAENKLYRINYDSADQTAVTLADLGNDPDNGSLNWANEIALDLANGRAFIISTETFSDYQHVPSNYPGAQPDPGNPGLYYALVTTMSQNSIHMVQNISSSDVNATGNTITQLTFSAGHSEDNSIATGTPQSNEFNDSLGRITDIEVNQSTGEIWFTAVQIGVPNATGGLYRATLNVGTGALTVTTIHNEGASNRNYMHIQIDEETGHYYVSSAEPGEQGQHAIYRGNLNAAAGTAPTLYADVGNVNEMTPRDMTLESAPTLTGFGIGSLALTETSSAPNSGETAKVTLFTGLTAGDIDTPNSGDELTGAVVRISSGFTYEASSTATGHTGTIDRLYINNQTSGTVPGGAGITFVYNETTGMMTLTGAATVAEYAAALQLVQFSTSGDNVTNNGTATTRTVSASVFDGLLYSDEVNATVNITGINDAPVNTIATGTFNFTEDSVGNVGGNPNPPPAVANAITGISFADADADATTETFTVTLSVQHGTLTVRTNVTGGLVAADVANNGTSTVTLTGTQTEINLTLAAVNGAATANGLVYTPTLDWHGPDTLTIVTNDQGNNGNDPDTNGDNGTSEADTDTITINVAAGVDIADDTLNAAEDAQATHTLNVLANDSFENADRSITAVTQGSMGGTVTINTNGTPQTTDDFIQYTPVADYNGAETFTYTVTSGGATETATVTVNLSAVADIANDAATVDEDSGATTIDVLGLDTFENSGRVITARGTASNGTVAIVDGPDNDGVMDYVTYTPNADYFGTDSFTYTVTSGGVTEQATVNVTVNPVNDPPVLVASAGTAAFTEGANVASTPVAIDPGITVDDIDSPISGATIVITTGASAGDFLYFDNNDSALYGNIAILSGTGDSLSLESAGSTATLAQWQNALRAVTYTSTSENPATTGRVVTFTVNDGEDPSNSVTRAVSVTAVNDAPENTVPATATTDEDVSVELSGMSVDDADATGDITYTLSVDEGTITLLTNVSGGIEASDIVDNGTGTVVITATEAQINATLAASGGVMYAPTGDYNGSDTLTVTASDGSGQDVDTRAITINAVNDAVTGAAPATLDVDQDTPKAVTGLAISDVDSALAPAGVYEVTLTSTNGTMTLTTTTGLTFTAGDGAGNATMTFHGTLADINTALATASYSPTTSFAGTADITLAVTDTFGGTVATGTGAATNDSDSIVVTVSGGNSAPTVDLDGTDPAVNYSTTYTEGGASVALGDTITVTDADSDDITSAVITITDPRNGDKLDFDTLPAGWTLVGSTGGSGEAIVTITGTGTAAEYAAYLNSARFSSTSHNPDGGGSDTSRTITVTVSDATGTSSPVEATIGIVGQNDPLEIDAADTDVQGTEDEDLVFSVANSDLIAIDDPDGALLTVTLTVTNGTLTLSQTTNLNITAGADGSATMTIEGLASDINAALAGLIYRGDLNYQGTDTLAISVGDGTDSDSENIAITLSDDGKIDGTPGGDDIVGTPQPDYILGYGGDDDIDGAESNDIIDGGAGADDMSGGLGNDTYYVDDAGDLTNENPGEGNDAVSSTIDWTLQANTENLRLLGTSDIDGTGNSLANVIIGNAGVNTLDGGEGADTLNGMGGDDVMIGGLGNDTFFVDSAGDQTIEAPGEGIDTVRSTVARTLDANIENLILLGNSAINGTGNGLSNSIAGNSAFNVLSGAGGNDTLSGGAGPDQLIGGSGDDVYVVDDDGDDVVENMNQGNDHVLASISYTLAANVEKVTLTGSDQLVATGNGLDNVMIGNSGNNALIGGGGNDHLNGMAGGDTMVGGAGNDLYVVDNVSEDIQESLNEGTDSVQSSIHYTLAANVENLVLTGTGNIDGYGNALANSIEGNSGNNILSGGLGADMMRGHNGNDTYIVDDAGDRVVELSATGGTDTVLSSVHFNLGGHVENLTLTGTGNIRGNGNGLDNVITGNTGNNTLNGLAGADTMIGGAGNDIYFVDHGSDAVVENSGEGVDTVHAAISHTLADHVDYLYLSGTGNIDGTGNGLDNFIEGNAGNNVLDGGTGADFMRGGAGSDTYVVDNALDRAVELNAAGGTDTVQSSVSFILGGHLENLVLTGAGNINGTGNTLSNSINGNSGNNVLRGNVGADALTGGAGTDTFIYGLVADSDATNGIDTILDFFSGDKIDLSAIDANGAAAGNGAFTLIDGAAFSNKAGELRVEDKGGYWELQGDTDGDGDADLVINLVLADADPITSGDFVL